ncbi:PAS fold [Octadecabacter temperatus]|uniref:Sensor protein DivL n=1 Tax=Octadecabacter temperatus TaxID=1458307 RepID=A0A0K0Y9Z4_9RHOB|nr:Sensor protein DivL [Octadecabacter temperatus]SIO39147.1 PAS fold [Octadecabacter temperatus]
MSQIGFLSVFGAILTGALCAFGFLAFWIRANRSSLVTARTLMLEAEAAITFLFDDETLVNASSPARDLMEHRQADQSDWEAFLSILSARFPDLRSQLSELAVTGRKSIKPVDGHSSWIEAEYWNGLARITLVQHKDHPDDTIDPLTANAIEHELETLRSIGEDSPQLIWKQDSQGVLTWANRSYIELSEVLFPAAPDAALPWPPRDVFSNIARPAGNAPIVEMHRIDVAQNEKPIWFEITSLKRGLDTIHFAIDATAVVSAKEAQRDFVQTLTKTFAQLSVGLAIFDADRRLVIFNPALGDLSLLPPDFLIARPTLFSFLDRLRDNRMMPEPKDYSSWRNQMAALESAAAEGSYQETWAIPNGQTFRVTGKPHPNGAIAFLLEDISDEVSLTRKFRSQIDVGSAVIDNLEAAVCVFSSSGTLVMANTAYQSLWGTQLDGAINSRDFSEESANWQEATAPSPIWVKLHEAVSLGKTEPSWSGRVWLDNQIEINCQYHPLPDGNHQVTFTFSEKENAGSGFVESSDFKPQRSVSV